MMDCDWSEYLVAAIEMGMSEEEFWKADPFLFNTCYEKYQERRISEVMMRGR